MHFFKLITCALATVLCMSFDKVIAKGFVFQTKADTNENHIKNSVMSFYKKYPQEKVFVHIDKPVYTNSETIWYKIYTMAYGKPSNLSKLIYVQLYDTAGHLVIQNKLPLINGRAHGNIDLNKNIKTGWYNLTSFTSWMMNFGRQSYFQQRIFIQNVDDITGGVQKNITGPKTYDIAFYPEGGDIITGAITNIAFKAMDENGNPAEVRGMIKDKANKVLTCFKTVHDGMGQFTLETAVDEEYSATIKFPDSSSQNISLPKTKNSGIALQVGQFTHTISVKVAFAGSTDQFGHSLLAAVQNNGQVVTYPLQVSKGINEFDLPKADFSTGILRLTVFDAYGQPAAERIVFVDHQDISTPTLKTDTVSFLPKGFNAYSVALKDATGNALKGNFSVSVTDAAAFNTEIDQNIFSALLLGPELQGNVHHPGYYFKDRSDSLAQQLDLVMLTNGWRHFTWKSILSNQNQPLVYPVEQTQYIAGQVLNYHNELKNKGDFQVKMMIVNQDSTRLMSYVTPDSAGKFIMRDFNHAGQSDLFIEATEKKNKLQKLNYLFPPTLSDSLKQSSCYPFTDVDKPFFLPYYLSRAKTLEKDLLLANSIFLKTVTIRNNKTTPTQKLIDERVSSLFRSDKEYTLDLVNNPTVDIGILNYIRGRFPGLRIMGDGPNAQFIYLSSSTLQDAGQKSPNQSKSGPSKQPGTSQTSVIGPYIYLNEAPTHLEDIIYMSMSDIALIRFVPPPIVFAPYNGGNIGALLVYTKRYGDDLRKIDERSDFSHFIFNGYSITREFAQPLPNEQGYAKTRDNRTLIFWARDLDTDSSGKLHFKFYNSDNTRSYRVILQGMDNQGKLLYFNQVIKSN